MIQWLLHRKVHRKEWVLWKGRNWPFKINHEGTEGWKSLGATSGIVPPTGYRTKYGPNSLGGGVRHPPPVRTHGVRSDSEFLGDKGGVVNLTTDSEPQPTRTPFYFRPFTSYSWVVMCESLEFDNMTIIMIIIRGRERPSVPLMKIET